MSNLNKLFSKKSSSSRSTSHPFTSSSSSRPTLHPSTSSNQATTEILNRILSQQNSFQKSMEVLLKNQETIQEDIKKIREEIAILSYDKDNLNAIISDTIKDLMKKKIYPNPAEMKAAITFFFKKTDDEFFSTFSNTGWNNYYNKKIRKNLTEKLRSQRSTACSQVKTAIFKVFANKGLPPINNTAKATEITMWKKKPVVLRCFKNLFTEINGNAEESETYMERIIKDAWPKKKNLSDQQISWAILITEIFLDPKNEYIKITEETILPILEKNKEKIKNKEIFKYSPQSSTPGSPAPALESSPVLENSSALESSPASESSPAPESSPALASAPTSAPENSSAFVPTFKNSFALALVPERFFTSERFEKSQSLSEEPPELE
ncbi:4385_t:CDS:2, partial [Dentiscutata erythropus]